MPAVPRVVHIVVACVPAAMALLFLRAGIDVFSTVKATVAVLAALVVAGVVGAGPATRAGTVARGARRGLPVMVAVLAGLLLVAAMTAPSPMRALVGNAGRHSGSAVWLAAIILAVAAHVVARSDGGAGVAAAIVAASVPVSLYALVQAAGRDPLAWSVVEGGPQVFATFGNADYLSAWLGMAIPLAAARALQEPRATAGRLLAAVAASLGTAAAVASGSLQGPVAGLAGGLVVLGVWWRSGTRERAGRRRGRRLVVAAVAVMVTIVVSMSLAPQPGSPGSVAGQVRRSFQTRVPIWSAAVRMAQSEPLFGVGPAHFSDEWFARRPESAVLKPRDEGMPVPALRLERPVDDAHALPLHLAATAGWPAALLWSLIAVVVLGRGVRNLRDSAARAGPPGQVRVGSAGRLQLAGLVGAATAAVIVQCVSVDVAPVTVTGWLLIGSVSGATVRWRGVRQDDPDGEESLGRTAAAAPRETAGRSRRPSAPRPVAVCAVVCTAAMAAVAVVPLAADLLAASVPGRGGDRRLALAGDLAPWESYYPARLAERQAARGELDAALTAQQEAFRRRPRDRAVAIDLARLTAAADGPAAAVAAYRAAVAIDDRTPVVLMEAGVNALEAGQPQRAVSLLRRAVERAPGQPAWLSLLRDAEEAARVSTAG